MNSRPPAPTAEESIGSIPTVHRIPTARLARIVFFEEAMEADLAITIRALRREHGLGYAEIMWALAESDPDAGQCHSFGQALTGRAHRLLRDGDDSWK
jgi:hypothetical protein